LPLSIVSDKNNLFLICLHTDSECDAKELLEEIKKLKAAAKSKKKRKPKKTMH